MQSLVRIIFYGSLRKQPGTGSDGCIELDLKKESSISDLLQRIQISPDQVQMCMRNHKAVDLEADVHPGDRIGLFPREYAIFVDWLEYRNRS